MLYWIFDLDNTLYQLPNNINFSYSYLSKDSQLQYLLNNLPLKKIIFTNGTYNHAIECFKKMRIEGFNSNNITARDTINDLKPNYDAYDKFIQLNNINSDDKCIFFDDLPENLINSKKFNWITVLINPNSHIHEDIDFWFPNIYIALNYFLCKLKQ
jgi:putative hydrolase of the HAD superfamily